MRKRRKDHYRTVKGKLVHVHGGEYEAADEGVKDDFKTFFLDRKEAPKGSVHTEVAPEPSPSPLEAAAPKDGASSSIKREFDNLFGNLDDDDDAPAQDPHAVPAEDDDGPKVGDNVEFDDLKVGMWFKHGGNDYEIEAVGNCKVSVKKCGHGTSVYSDFVWSEDFAPYLELYALPSAASPVPRADAEPVTSPVTGTIEGLMPGGTSKAASVTITPKGVKVVRSHAGGGAFLYIQKNTDSGEALPKALKDAIAALPGASAKGIHMKPVTKWMEVPYGQAKALEDILDAHENGTLGKAKIAKPKASKGPVLGSHLNKAKLKQGMKFLDGYGHTWTITNDPQEGYYTTVTNESGVTDHLSGKNWNAYQKNAWSYAGMDGDGGPKVGDTKVENGQTYILNANHRWELVEKAVAAKASALKITGNGAIDIRGWTQVGDQKGSNPGALYQDTDGKKWYVKFPKTEEIAKNEMLASKLYQACDVATPDIDLITKDGKIGIASEFQEGLDKVKDGSLMAKQDGALEGFVADAWLGNWDVVGLGHDNLLLSNDGKAVRIDPGGALLYRAQGEAKGDSFGNTVPELHTLRDSAKNEQSASVFGGITHEQLVASAAKVLQLSDDDIKTMVKTWGPGGSDDRDRLAEKLIARKHYLAKQFPDAAPKPTVDIKPTPNFKEWNGPGKGLSSKVAVNEQNQAIAEEIHALGKANALSALEAMSFQPIQPETGVPIGSPDPITAHKSHWITDYWKDTINKVKNPEITYKKVKSSLLANLKAMAGQAYAIVNAFPDVKKLKECKERIGRYGVLGHFGTNPLEGWAPKELSEKNKGVDIQNLYDESRKSYNKLSSVQKQAIKAYTGSEYHTINNAETGEGTSGQTQHAISGLDQACVPLPEGMVLSRKFSFPTDPGGNHKLLMASEGDILKDFGCISTATRPDIWSGQYQLRITCAGGVKGLFVAHDPSGNGSPISSNAGERETILPYGTKFLVRKIHQSAFSDEHGHWGGGEGGIVIDVVALPNSDMEN